MLPIAILTCLAGLAAVYVRLRREFPRGIVFIAVALLGTATSLTWYTAVEPSIVDVAAFALAAWAGVGAESAQARRAPALRAAAYAVLCGIPIAVIAVTAASASHLLQSRVADVLFSSWHGFLSWTPVAYVALVGTLAYASRNRPWALATTGVTLIAAWLAGSAADWTSEPAFGARRMVAVLALLAPGLAFALEWVRKHPAIAIAPLVLAAIFWTQMLMVQYTVGLLPKDEPISFSRLVRGQADAYTRGLNFYPFAFPANVWFAWREGVPVDRYELLALAPRAETLDLKMDRRSDRLLLEGWDAPGVDEAGPVWWLGGRTATVAVPLAPLRDRDIEITVQARSRYEEPVVEAEVGLRINGHDVGGFNPSPTAPTDARIVIPAHQARTLFRAGINKITFVSLGTHRVAAGDTREAGPLAKRAGNPAWPVAIYRITIRPL